MPSAHPLRPLVLALSIRLNGPGDLLMELRDLPVETGGEFGPLGRLAHQAAVGLAGAAISFNHADDVMATATSEPFVAGIRETGTRLVGVATARFPRSGVWGEEGWAAEMRFRKACLDMGVACLAVAGGRIPRPDKANLLTTLAKAIPRDLEHVDWTFYTLPDYGSAAGPEA